jgi:hypothetical protein
MLWWALLEPAQARSSESELTIPNGTAAAIARGAQPPFVPNNLELSRNGDLTIINNDTEPHEIGSWTIPPGSSAVISAPGQDGEFTCTITPTGVLGFTVDQRPSFSSTLYAALALGLPAGLAFGFASVITRRLDTGGTET